MIREIRIYWALRPYIKKLQEQTKMKFSLNLVVQILGTITQAANSIGALVPAKYQTVLALGVGVIQAVTAFLAHFSNPDGTTATEAYKPVNKGVVK